MNVGVFRMKMFTGRQKGYNLVEVLVAMAVLGAVLLSVIGLFYMGRRNVYSGKQLTFANSVGTQVMEDLSSLTMTSLYAAFKITSTSSLSSNVVNGITYPNSLVRKTTAVSAATEANPPGFLTRWQTAINSPNRLQDPSVNIIMTPTTNGITTSNLMTTTTPVVPAPAIMRIRVVILWKEGQKTRSLTFDTVKTQRS